MSGNSLVGVVTTDGPILWTNESTKKGHIQQCQVNVKVPPTFHAI